jgi:glycopeptide antibiotics resistance protein
MASRSHFAAPLLLAVFTGLIFYVSLYPFRFVVDGPSLLEALRVLTWARASRGDMFNNLLLYVPFGFCVALLIEPRWGRFAGLIVGSLVGAFLSLGLELLQASFAPRVSSLTDLSLNAAGSFIGAVLGSGFHALGNRMAPQSTVRGRSKNVAFAILVLWLVERLWPLIPDPGLRQLKLAVRPLLSPQVQGLEMAGYFVGWLVIAQAVFHVAKRQRAVDFFLIVIATVLVGRTFIAGSTLVAAEIAAIALLLPVLVLLSRLEDRGRSVVVALLLGSWLAWAAAKPLINGQGELIPSLPAFKELLLRNVPAPPLLANKAFSYMSLAWLLAGAGLVPHVAAGMTVLFVLLLVMLQLGAAVPVFGWVDLLIAVVAGWIVARWIPKGQQ